MSDDRIETGEQVDSIEVPEKDTIYIKELSKGLGITIIDNKKRYWLIRTKSGLYFEDFIKNEFVGIGWNRVNQASIDKIRNFSVIMLKKRINKLYPNEKRKGLVANYIFRFCHDIKQGDIVMIPSRNSRQIAFGEIIDDNVYYENIKDAVEKEEEIERLFGDNQEDNELFNIKDEFEKSPYIKRRKVRWLKRINKSEIDSKLLPALYSHNAISNKDKYSSLIDRTLNSFFIKDNEMHLLLNVTKQTEITFGDYVEFHEGLISIINEFNSTFKNYRSDIKDMEMKINVESPGIMELISKISPSQTMNAVTPVLVIGIIITGFFGGSVSFATFKFETPGLMPFIQGLKRLFEKSKNKELKSTPKLEKAVLALKIKSKRPIKVKNKR